MKKFLLTAVTSLTLLSPLPASADLVGNWGGAVTITAINMGGNGEFVIVAPNAPSPGSCGGYYRVYINSAMNITTAFGLEMLHKHAVSALISGKKASIFHSNDTFCYVGFIQLNAQ
jgi:hypothetical protein